MITAITTRAIPTTHQADGLQGLQKEVSKAVKGVENYLMDDVKTAFDPNGKLMGGLPKHVEDSLIKAEQSARDPETRALYQTYRNNLTTLNQHNQEFLRNRYQSKIQAQQIELSLKAVSKTMSGIQQLLTSQ